LVRSVWEDQRRFPLQIATVLSQQFAARGLQFFKVNKAVTHVCVARPHYLDLTATPVSDGVKRIVEYINAHAKTNRRKLIEALSPSPAPSPIRINPPAAVAPAAPLPAADEPTAEQTVLIADLHWLIHQGHVIEFATGVLETAKKPLPKPPKPARPEKPASETAAVAAPTGETAVVGEEAAAASSAPESAPASQTAEAAPGSSEASQTGAVETIAVVPESSPDQVSPPCEGAPAKDAEAAPGQPG